VGVHGRAEIGDLVIAPRLDPIRQRGFAAMIRLEQGHFAIGQIDLQIGDVEQAGANQSVTRI